MSGEPSTSSSSERKTESTGGGDAPGAAGERVLLTNSELRSLEQFHVLEELGEGSYSTVYLASTKKAGVRYALKICSKLKIQREKKIKQIFRERDVLRLLSEDPQPFIVQLMATFHDESSLYFVLTYARHRDIAAKMERQKFDLDTSRFVIAELVLALAYIHSKRVLHRDVKPQNILVKEDFHIMLSDFGCCITFDERDTIQESDRVRKTSFVGSNLYVTPEVLTGKLLDETCDYFAVGSILHEMLVAKAPFYDGSEYLIFQRIANNRYVLDENFPDVQAKDLIQGFLKHKQDERLGSPAKGGFDAIRSHPFFKSIDWDQLNKIASPLSAYYQKSNGA